MSKKNIIQESIQDVTVSIQDEIASKAVRKSTLKSIKEKKKSPVSQRPLENLTQYVLQFSLFLEPHQSFSHPVIIAAFAE